MPHVPARGEQKPAHVPLLSLKSNGREQNPAEIIIPSPLSHFPNGTIIHKLFNKEYWKARVIRNNTKRAYYTVRYDNNDEEELTHEEINVYLIPLDKGEYWTEQQSGRRRSKRIGKIKCTGGYTGAIRALDPTWYSIHELSKQECKHLASTVVDEETGRRLEYRHLIEHPYFRDDWLKSGANEFYRLFQESKTEPDRTKRIKGTNTLFWINIEQVSKNKTTMYARVVVDKRPDKEEVNQRE